MKKRLFSLILFLMFSTTLFAKIESKSAHILQTDDYFSHHVIVVEKSTHRLFLYENLNGSPGLIKVIDIATGKSKGDKKIQGDRKTPEGIYFIYDFLSDNFLTKKYGKYGEIYGIGAFPLNYPNVYDKLESKTGGGIWLHSTDDDNRVDKKLDSKGCVVLKKNDLLEISRYLDTQNKTPVIIVEKAYTQDKKSHLEEKSSILSFIISWQQAWKSQNLFPYISHYDSTKYRDRTHGSFKKFLRYKKQVFSKNDRPSIAFSHHSIFVNEDYAIVQMLQSYESSKLKDIGKKTIYLQKDDRYHWKIVAEHWEKVKLPLKKFNPQQKYFTNAK